MGSSSSSAGMFPSSSMPLSHNSSSKKSFSNGSSSAAAAVLSSAVALASSSSPSPLLPPPSSLSLSSSSSMLSASLTSSSPPSSGLPGSSPAATAASLTAAAASSISQNSSLTSSSTHILLRHPDAIPTLISLLNSPNREVHEQAMWILGSVAAGEGSATTNAASNPTNPTNIANVTTPTTSSSNSSVAAAREAMLAAGVMGPLIRCVEANPHNLSLQRIGSWALSNLVDGQFQHTNANANATAGNNKNSNSCSSSNNNMNADIHIDARMLLPTLRRLLLMADAEVLSHTCWTLSHLCDGPSSHIAAVVSPAGGLVPRLVDLLLHPSWRVTKPALRTIGNVVCAECVDDSASSSPTLPSCFNDDDPNNSVPATPIPTDYTEIILECGAVPRLKELITHGNREIQKEACWTLSNIAAGTVDQIQAVIDSGAIPPLVKLASEPNTDQEVRSEACWVVLNATSCGSDAQIEVLVAEGCVSVLGMLLGEASMVMMALEGLERVLQVEEAKEMERKSRIVVDSESGAISNAEYHDSATRGSLVSASLIEALEQHKNSAVSKRAGKIWKQHFVSCALCRQSFSRHRSSEARFCKECKCHVCSKCDCEVYHLSYQEELWAANEEKTQAKTKAKKSKKQKKKEKRKQAKKQHGNSGSKSESNNTNNNVCETSSFQGRTARSMSNVEDESVARSRSSTTTSSSDSASANGRPPVNELAVVSSPKPQQPIREESSSCNVPISNDKANTKKMNGTKKNKKNKKASSASTVTSNGGNTKKKSLSKVSASTTTDDDEDDDVDEDHMRGENGIEKTSTTEEKTKDCSDIDLVLYLQQTGSIIALAKLMDALEYGDVDGSDHYLPSTGLDVDDNRDQELQILNGQRLLSRQTEA
eukprot:CAMPEP_0172504466 /NCGR_PEP_ID=MMETSP1066-20121228/178970_1 /TAXON_ID=671091 /ORGANISM="Coscinodiscus wailesii, Strain CCMP2513" /LENGTH=878 /DNA_ID=CAMNT_0013280661 /DNA_START=527 /DNA_END=3163 /DNA_ORIENTATION=-